MCTRYKVARYFARVLEFAHSFFYTGGYCHRIHHGQTEQLQLHSCCNPHYFTTKHMNKKHQLPKCLCAKILRDYNGHYSYNPVLRTAYSVMLKKFLQITHIFGNKWHSNGSKVDFLSQFSTQMCLGLKSTEKDVHTVCAKKKLPLPFNETERNGSFRSRLIASEASFLVCSMRVFSLYIYICLYISGRMSCRKCSKCFYVYLNIRPVRYSARIESVANTQRQQLRTARQLRTAQSPKERDARLQQLRTAREQTIATESTEERQTRLQQLRSVQQQRIAAETPEEIEARLQQLSTAQQQDCSATGLLPNRQRGERPDVNGLPLSHRRKETPVFNRLQLLVNRRLRQNRLRGSS